MGNYYACLVEAENVLRIHFGATKHIKIRINKYEIKPQYNSWCFPKCI